MWLVAEHDDVEGFAVARQDVLDEPGSGHPVADHDEATSSHQVVSSSDTTARAETAHTLNSGIRLTGSSAAFVNRFADCSSGQWNGTKIVSSRIERVSFALNDAVPRRVVSRTRSSFSTPAWAAVSGCISATGSGVSDWSWADRRVCVPD